MIRTPHLFFPLVLLPVLLPLLAGAAIEEPQYELAISFEPQQRKMSGTAHISLSPQEELTVSLQGITATGIILNRDGSEALTMKLPEEPQLFFPASSSNQEIYISYTKTVGRSYTNRIKGDGIVLTSNWYPQPDRDMFYSLKATVPQGFTSISESDKLHFDNQKEIHSFALSQALPGIHFVAAPYRVNRLQVREGLTIYTLFFDDSLAEEYLQTTAGYIKRYESQLGPFPYNHYVVVENHLPTGYGMPTFTLLGQTVIRLPFIKDTSLGHEVLHSWFGNAVGVEGSDGNWCEGLTSYLADWAYREDKGEGAANRKENILGYLSYVTPERAIPLTAFSSASHYQSMARAIRAVGYTKGAMLFHELKTRIGDESFLEGLRLLVSKFAGEKASWQDVRKVFEKTGSMDLSAFFTERLSRKDIPSLAVENIASTSENGRVGFSFDLIQETEIPYTLQVPLMIKTAEEEVRITHQLSNTKTTVNLELPDPPLSLTLDPDYDLLRRLHSSELIPVWSQFIGAEKKLVVLASEEQENIFQPLIERLQDDSWKITHAKDVKNADLSKTSLLFLGIDSNTSRSLFGLPDHPKEGFSLDVRTNPLNNKHVAVLVSSKRRKETAAVAHRLSHYGKYSYLHFQEGRVVKKEIHPSTFGDTYTLEQLPTGGPATSLNSFEAIVDALSRFRVVYVGESHTSYADHLLQLRLIQALYARNPNFSIGMEMFPQSSQRALDDYIFDEKEMTEATFLKKSRYFDVWRYDWRFFRDIFNFAKRNGIPIRGLNVDRDIVSQVFKKGSTDGLTEEIINSLPVDRDLSMTGYRQRLEDMHALHAHGGHGSGMMSGFIQAQGLWDETMAQAVAEYIQDNPETQMVVLAGAQHTRKDSGIPPRVKRRLDVPQASVLNIYQGGSPTHVKELADYFFLAEDLSLPPAAKIGVVLNEIKEDGKSFMQIVQISPHGNAEKAGLQEKDILLAINGHPSHNMEDIKIAMIGARDGDMASLFIRRNRGIPPDEELTLEVELYTPKMDKPHP